MNPENWTKVKALFDAAVELEPSDRQAFLDRSCGPDDDDLRREVESLLASADDSESFLEQPAAGQVASLILEPKRVVSAGDMFGITRSCDGSAWEASGKCISRKMKSLAAA